MDQTPVTAEGAQDTSPDETAVQDEQLEQIIRQWDLDEEDAANLRSITRLLVGGTLVGYDELIAFLHSWEDETRRTIVQQNNRAPAARVPGAVSTPSESPATVLRYAALGLLFEGQDRWVRRGRAAFNFFGQTTNALLSPAAKRMNQDSRLLRPAQSRFEKLVRKGETVAGRWVQRGRVEEAYGRRFAGTAGQQGFNSSMDQLGSAPALQDLVRKQSAGLTQDVLDEVRERTVTGDYAAEHVARSLLRRVPRRYLPPSTIPEELPEQE
jgi:hypothetical protein